MKKLVTMFIGLGLLSQQALAVTESVTGEIFAGYANSVLGTSGSFTTDLGNSVGGTSWSTDLDDVTTRITDTSAGTNILGTTTGAYLDLGFDTSIFDGPGNDLKLFFVGGNDHFFDVTIGGVTNSYSILSSIGATTFSDSAWPTDPVVAMAIDLSSSEWNSLGGGSYSGMRLTIGDGYDADSAVASFAGTYNVVPVPAAVWLFGSGLIGLVGLAKRKQK